MASASLRVCLVFLPHTNQFSHFLSVPRSPEPQDHDTAISAVRNLNGADVGGRPLRIDLADSDPFPEGKTTVHGELVDSGGPDNKRLCEKDRRGDRRQGRGLHTHSFLANLPPGVQIPPGSTALDTIGKSLVETEPSQLLEVLAQMKVCTKPTVPPALRVTSPEQRFC
jgi:cleavage stimulation factor subunit 2